MSGHFRKSSATRSLLAIPLLAILAVSLLATAGPSSALAIRPAHTGRSVDGTRLAAATTPPVSRTDKLRDVWPSCPAKTDYCYINLHFDTIAPCPSFTAAVGLCVGSSTGTVGFTAPISSLPRLAAIFNWLPNGGDRKSVTYSVVAFGVPVVFLEGAVPGPGSADFDVRMGWSLESPYPLVRYFTPRRPGVKAGEPGGPLYLNFENGRVGADVYIHGYLATENTLRFSPHVKTAPAQATAPR